MSARECFSLLFKSVWPLSLLLWSCLCMSCSSVRAPGPRRASPSPTSTERAVPWLVGQQRSDGHWGTGEHRTTLTCLATLALLCCGETPASDGPGRTMQKALRAVLHDAETKNDRPQEERELLVWCLAETYARTRIPLLLEPLRRHVGRLDVRQASPWMAPAAAAVFDSGAAPESDRKVLLGMRAHYPMATNSMVNQATHLFLACRTGDLQGARRHLAAVRALRPDKWKECDAPLQAAVMLTPSLVRIGGKDWYRWLRVLAGDTDCSHQTTRGRSGWWTAETLGLPASGMPNLSERERDVYVTSLVLMARFLPRVLPSNGLRSLGEPDDSPDAGIEVIEL